MQAEAAEAARIALLERLVVGSTLLKVSHGGKLARVSAAPPPTD